MQPFFPPQIDPNSGARWYPSLLTLPVRRPPGVGNAALNRLCCPGTLGTLWAFIAAHATGMLHNDGMPTCLHMHCSSTHPLQVSADRVQSHLIEICALHAQSVPGLPFQRAAAVLIILCPPRLRRAEGMSTVQDGNVIIVGGQVAPGPCTALSCCQRTVSTARTSSSLSSSAHGTSCLCNGARSQCMPAAQMLLTPAPSSGSH